MLKQNSNYFSASSSVEWTKEEAEVLHYNKTNSFDYF